MDKVASGSGLLARTLIQTTMFSMPLRQAGRMSTSFISTRQRLAQCMQQGVQGAPRSARMLSSTTAAREADSEKVFTAGSDGLATKTATAETTPTTTTMTTTPASSRNLMEGLADLLPTTRNGNSPSSAMSSATSPRSASSALGTALGGLSGLDDLDRMKREVDSNMEEYHFSIYGHKHNTHVTVSKPNRNVIVSMSCGNLGFLKAQRGSYDAAYQLGAYVCDWLYQRGWHKTIQRLEVTLRGFGPGREAVTKILLGNEGRLLRRKITRVADATRLKFGGTRSKKPRRLG